MHALPGEPAHKCSATEHHRMAVLMLLLPLLLVISFGRAETCYWPNGDTAPDNYHACPNSKVCCSAGEACLSNGLCYGANLNIAYRGACTDKSWPIAECTRVCYTEIDNGWANLYPCPNNTNQVFTCGAPGWASSVCEADLGTVTWPSGDVSYAKVSNSTTTSSTASSTSTTTGATGTPSVRESPTDAAESNKSSDNSVALGAGLGVGLGVPLVLMSLFLFILWRRSKKQVAQTYATPAPVMVEPKGSYGHTMTVGSELEGSQPPVRELQG
ncbi:hypothetical protein BDV25DRAFT_91385 [Aspergillus avenaceus]|uniref:Mid2 domain-containing protein n=1 Tax=Aspergillus avenaceus TaxID=36643 RepID=A0A5N6TYS2_ASPAV|nr:hypothetical protein BDV25DRAFT_91385 [Aspergillus avenaceus]